MDKKTYNALWRAKHPDYFKEYYQAHKGEIKAKNKAKKKRKTNAERQAKWRANHPEYYGEWLAREGNLDKHREHARASWHAYYKKNKAKILAKQKADRERKKGQGQ